MDKFLAILTKEVKSDFRNPYIIGGSVLFLLSTLFVCYITVKRLSAPSIWVALYWIIILFSAFNAVAKSFANESRSRMLYLYTLSGPGAYITAKAVYHSLVLVILALAAYVVYSTFFGMAINDPVVFFVSIVLGASGIAVILSLLSTIASKAGNNLTLMAILALPILLPMLMVSTTLMKNAIDGIDLTVQWKYLFVLGGLNVVSLGLSVVLFPYLWRE